MAVDISQFHDMFFEESFEGLEVMENGLLKLSPGSADIELINDIFRAAHSIKGGAGTFGFSGVSEFTHDLETLLDLMRDKKFEVTSEAVELMLQSVDCLRQMLTELKDQQSVDYTKSNEISQLFKELMERNATGTVNNATNTVNKEEIELQKEQVEIIQTGSACFRVHFKPFPELLQTGNEPYRIFRELTEMGVALIHAVLDDLPSYETLDPSECYLAWYIEISGESLKLDQVEEVFEWVVDECDLKIEKISVVEVPVISPDQEAMASANIEDSPKEIDANAEGSRLASNAEGLSSPSISDSNSSVKKIDLIRNQDSKSIRVNIEKVDTLINMVGEMVITQSMLCQLSKSYSEERHDELIAGLAQLEANTRDLQETVMSLRMMPISFAFNRFPRLVRDLNSQLSKNVELKLYGEQTELDKTVMEKLGDPLTHLVRNAMDHGMETPAERIEKGKPEIGNVQLKAFYEGGSVVIQICDDGKGLDLEKIRHKAITNGLIQESDTLSKEELQELILRPGFSTAEEINDLSGRGVGLDVVKQNIRALSGSLEVQSLEGHGTTFTIRLPLTLAIVDGQLIRVDDSVYIVPLTSISESLQLDSRSVNRVVGSVDLYRLREENIPVVHLNQLFGHSFSKTENETQMMVVVESNERKIGLVVDELLDQQQVVIKSLEANYQGVEGLSGATILGDGTVALICDIHDIFSMSASRYKMSFDKFCLASSHDAA